MELCDALVYQADDVAVWLLEDHFYQFACVDLRQPFAHALGSMLGQFADGGILTVVDLEVLVTACSMKCIQGSQACSRVTPSRKS
jgi:hypothetical protein